MDSDDNNSDNPRSDDQALPRSADSGSGLCDNVATISQLKNVVHEFVAERSWEKFHSPKNISMAMAIEVAELMEHFQWISQDESRHPDAEKRVQIEEEMSDVFCYLMALANSLDVNLAEAFERKMKLNRQKYPADEFRGRFGVDDPSPIRAE